MPKGTLMIRAAEQLGIQIPRFCDHPLLDPVGACRQCLVEIEGQRKPVASCTTVCTDGMVVKTQLTSPVAEKAQQGVMELLLINHPLDCPVCDKGGECPLQNQALSNGRGESRFHGVKRTFEKPVPISTEVLLDRERCVLCARCTRPREQIAGDPFIDLIERGPRQQIGIADGQAVPVLLLRQHRADLPGRRADRRRLPVPVPPVRPGLHAERVRALRVRLRQRTDHRRGKVLRRLAGDDPQVNEEWNCDKGRWAFATRSQPDRLTTPLVRDEAGELVPASWRPPRGGGARAGRGRADAAGDRRRGVLAGGRLTLEDAYAYAKFARVALGTNDVDFRARPHSAEEAEFLAARVAGRDIEVSYADLEAAPAVLLAGFEPEEESPIVFLRLRKAARKTARQDVLGRRVRHAGPDQARRHAAAGRAGHRGRLAGGARRGRPQRRRRAAAAEPAAAGRGDPGRRAAGRGAGRAGAAVRLAEATGARLAWIPRRAGERGAVEAGALPGLLPGGRPVSDPQARAEVAPPGAWPACRRARPRTAASWPPPPPASWARWWSAASTPPTCPTRPPRCARSTRRLPGQPGASAQRGDRPRRRGVPGGGGGREGGHLPGLGGPGRARSTPPQRDPASAPTCACSARSRTRWTCTWACPTRPRPAANWTRWAPGTAPGPRRARRSAQARPAPDVRRGRGACSPTWHQLLDDGRLQDGEPDLAATAHRSWPGCPRPPRPRRASPTATRSRWTSARLVTVPLGDHRDARPGGVAAANSPGSAVRADLGAGHGSRVTLRRAE